MSCQTFRRGFSCAVIIFFLILHGNAIALFKEGLKLPPPKRVIANELIIKLKSGATPSTQANSISVSSFSTSPTLRSLMNKYGVSEIKSAFPKRSAQVGISSAADNSLAAGVYKLTISNLRGMDIKTVAQDFKSDSNVVYAEPNYLFRTCRSPNDPYYDKQWGLTKIRASGGWDAMIGNPSIVVAVVDTGVDYRHPDLSSNIWTNPVEIPGNGIDDDGNGYVDDVHGWDFVSVPPDWAAPGEDPGPEDNDPMDFAGHGTHVSGIAAGRSNNFLGTAGLSWDSKIMPVRAGYAASDGYGYLEYFDAGRAIVYAADNGADVINMSWGGLDDSALIRDAIAYAYGKGCVLVASAGNVDSGSAGTLFYPAAYPQVMAVASTDQDDMLSIWSMTVFSNFGPWVTVCAPGTNIISTLPGRAYGYHSGTSMAAPFVSGLAALVKAKYPYFTNDQIMRRIKDTADNVDGANPGFLAGQLGAGRINAHKALGNVRIGIDYPKDGSRVGNKVLIKGNADVENFKSYKLDYGVGDTPNLWLPIVPESPRPVIGNTLADWDATALSGDYTIRLSITDVSGETYTTTSNVNISANADVELVGHVIPAPNPYDPSWNFPMKLHFEVGSIPSSGADIDLCIYDITGTMIWRSTNHCTGVGGYDVLWSAVNAFNEKAANGVYPLFLISDKKVIGKSKIAIVR